MRLINYEEYKNKLLEVRDSIPLTVPAATYELMLEKPDAHGMSMRGGIRKALRCLEECQNVSDVAPVIYGKWKNGNPICPICGENKFKDLDADIWCDWQPDYCPWCGARMYRGENDG